MVSVHDQLPQLNSTPRDAAAPDPSCCAAVFVCRGDPEFGDGRVGDVSVAACLPDEVGDRRATCRADGQWVDLQDTCVLAQLQNLLNQSEVITFDLDVINLKKEPRY